MPFGGMCKSTSEGGQDQKNTWRAVSNVYHTKSRVFLIDKGVDCLVLGKGVAQSPLIDKVEYIL